MGIKSCQLLDPMGVTTTRKMYLSENGSWPGKIMEPVLSWSFRKGGYRKGRQTQRGKSSSEGQNHLEMLEGLRSKSVRRLNYLRGRIPTPKDLARVKAGNTYGADWERSEEHFDLKNQESFCCSGVTATTVDNQHLEHKAV